MERIQTSILKCMLPLLTTAISILSMTVFAAPPNTTPTTVININDQFGKPAVDLPTIPAPPPPACPAVLVELHNLWIADPAIFPNDMIDDRYLCRRGFIDSYGTLYGITMSSGSVLESGSGILSNHINFVNVEPVPGGSVEMVITAAELKACAVSFSCANMIIND